jgi:hypothetical protein
LRLQIFEYERDERKEAPVNIQQAEGRHLRERSIVMRRQALRRTVASVPRRDRLASVLVLLLTATGVLVTPTFGDNREEIPGYGQRRMAEGVKGIVECISEGPLERVLKCQAEAYRIFEEGLQWCMRNPESCRGIEEPLPASQPAECPDRFVRDGKGNCVTPAMACYTDEAVYNLGYCGKMCDVIEPQGLIIEGGGVIGGAKLGGEMAMTLCAPWGSMTAPWGLIATGGCAAAGVAIGGYVGYLGAQVIDTCYNKCLIDFQKDRGKCQRLIPR